MARKKRLRLHPHRLDRNRSPEATPKVDEYGTIGEVAGRSRETAGKVAGGAVKRKEARAARNDIHASAQESDRHHLAEHCSSRTGWKD